MILFLKRFIAVGRRSLDWEPTINDRHNFVFLLVNLVIANPLGRYHESHRRLWRIRMQWQELYRKHVRIACAFELTGAYESVGTRDCIYGNANSYGHPQMFTSKIIKEGTAKLGSEERLAVAVQHPAEPRV
jgi:hypothetical protein